MFPGFTDKEILPELRRILSSDLFSRSKVLSAFLKFVVLETLAGRTDELKEYTIAVSGLGKSPDFNPQIDAIVRIHAGRLRRLLHEFYQGEGSESNIRIELVKGTYVPVFRSQQLNESSDISDQTDNGKPTRFSRMKLTIAVLPFRNLCPNQDYEFFVDGLGEELTNIFSSFKEISVVAHHSTRRYSANLDDVCFIGGDLGTHYLINGSVKRSSKEIKVNVGLLETVEGTQIWSKSYSQLLDEEKIFDIQDQIINDVFATLSGHFGLIISNSAKNIVNLTQQSLTSFDAILWNYYVQQNHSQEAADKGRIALESALKKDSENVMCLVSLGDLYLFSYSLGYPTVEDPLNEALKLIKKAVTLDPQSQYAHLIYGWALIYLNKKEEAINALNYSIQLGAPSASYNGTLGFGLACAGEYEQAIVRLDESLKLNPYCPWWYNVGYYFIFFQKGCYQEALDYAVKINVSDDVYLKPLLKAAAMAELGLIAEATDEARFLTENFPHILKDLKASMNSFTLDHLLVDSIIAAVKKVGILTS
jgi:TolB-like protein